MKKEVDFLKQEVEDLGATTSASSVLALAACAIVSFF
jgi:hypothetical protein